MEVWLVKLWDCAEALESEEARHPRLSDDDLIRINDLKHPETRRQRRLAAIALRRLLAWYVGTDRYDRMPFQRRPGGRPVVGDGKVAFSLSHSGGQALIALGTVGALGVDLEPLRTLRMPVERQLALVQAASFLPVDPPLADDPALTLPEGTPTATSSSVKSVGAILDAVSTEQVLQAWVRLEAIAKAHGGGIGPLLTAAGVIGAPHGQETSRGNISAAELSRRTMAVRAHARGLAVRDLDLPSAKSAAGTDSAWFAALACDANALRPQTPSVRNLDAEMISGG